MLIHFCWGLGGVFLKWELEPQFIIASQYLIQLRYGTKVLMPIFMYRVLKFILDLGHLQQSNKYPRLQPYKVGQMLPISILLK